MSELSPLQLAIIFHDRYEMLAPSYGYETREETRHFDPESANGKLMIAVCDGILSNRNQAMSKHPVDAYLKLQGENKRLKAENEVLREQNFTMNKKLNPCPTCKGSGKLDDADFGDIAYNEWPCPDCASSS